MNLLSLEHINRSYGEKTLFEDLNLNVNQGDKIALIARNGNGKSSLMRIIAGIEEPEGEQAKVLLFQGTTVGFLMQEPEFPHNATIIEAVLSGNDQWITVLKDYDLAQKSHDPHEIQKALLRMDESKAWEIELRVKELLGKFRLPDYDYKVEKLSGGQKKRLALVQLLCGKPEFLILDEPTNHLDLDMIEWLEKYLSQQSLTVFMVTHDRYFLNRVCNQILEIDRGKLYKYSGSYEDFLEKKAARIANEQTFKEKSEKFLRKELDWINRMPKARTTKNKARVDSFFDLKDKLKGPSEDGEIEFDIESPRLGSKIIELHHAHKKYSTVEILKDFSYKFKPKEKIGIIGPNGSGKSTFLDLITGAIKPDSGKIVIGETVKFGFYRQDGMQLRDDKRVIDVIREIADYIPLKGGKKMSAESLLERFLFPRSQQQVFVSLLSGGERRRLYLLTILIQNPNFLILDEPTNDLDIITLNVLEEYLKEFEGCVIIVSHDRYFMDKIVDHLFVLEGNGYMRDFPGHYTAYREQFTSLKAAFASSEPKADVEDVSEKPKEKIKKLGFNEKREMGQLEKDIQKLHTEQSELIQLFSQENVSSERIVKANMRLAEISQLLETKELRWMELAELG